MILDRIQCIIKLMDENSITAYEVAQNTTLSQQAIDKIKNGKSQNPRPRTLDEIEEYLHIKTKSLKNKTGSDLSGKFVDSDSIEYLEKSVIKNWDKLKEMELLKMKLEIETKDITGMADLLNYSDEE